MLSQFSKAAHHHSAMEKFIRASIFIVMLCSLWLMFPTDGAAGAGNAQLTITSFNPTSGGPGTTVVITGTDFEYVTSVKIGNCPASFTVNQALTQITAKVCAVCSGGTITIVTAHFGTVTSVGKFSCKTIIGPGSQTQSSSSGGPTAWQEPMHIPNVVVQTASLSTDKVAPGAPVTVTANVANTGTADGSSQIKLFVNGQEEAHQGVTLSSGSSNPVKFTVSRDEPGTYSVYVGSIPAGSFVVDQFADPNLILYISGALLLFALAGGVIFMAMRRR